MTIKQQKLLKYLQSCIDFTGYAKDGAILLDTVNNVLATYEEEVGSRETIKYRLRGLPSCLSLAFSYYDISKVLGDCGYKETTNATYQDKYYWSNIAKFVAMGKNADIIV